MFFFFEVPQGLAPSKNQWKYVHWIVIHGPANKMHPPQPLYFSWSQNWSCLWTLVSHVNKENISFCKMKRPQGVGSGHPRSWKILIWWGFFRSCFCWLTSAVLYPRQSMESLTSDWIVRERFFAMENSTWSQESWRSRYLNTSEYKRHFLMMLQEQQWQFSVYF